MVAAPFSLFVVLLLLSRSHGDGELQQTVDRAYERRTEMSTTTTSTTSQTSVSIPFLSSQSATTCAPSSSLTETDNILCAITTGTTSDTHALIEETPAADNYGVKERVR
eukprot:GHVS01035752.1.p1 GENE.GHVS01035752.1~~GHVS01035752.1.p1  ORF type:complete len:109 (-),score=26.62 GHVS01035752.1:175-501(-)